MRPASVELLTDWRKRLEYPLRQRLLKRMEMDFFAGQLGRMKYNRSGLFAISQCL